MTDTDIVKWLRDHSDDYWMLPCDTIADEIEKGQQWETIARQLEERVKVFEFVLIHGTIHMPNASTSEENIAMERHVNAQALAAFRVLAGPTT